MSYSEGLLNFKKENKQLVLISHQMGIMTW